MRLGSHDHRSRDAMRFSIRALNLTVEPAGATALAGALGPLRESLKSMKRIGILVCGSSIDLPSPCATIDAAA